MAGDWVAMRVDLYRNPKVLVMTKRLLATPGFVQWMTGERDMSRDCHVTMRVTVCVTCHALSQAWGIANELGKADGDDLLVGHLVIAGLDEITGVPGIGAAMEAVGWAVHEERNGIDYVRFPDFMVYNIPSEKRSATKAAERKRRQRDRERDIACDMSRDASVTKRDKSHGTGQDSTEHNTNTNTPLPPKGKKATRPTITAADCAFPPELDTPAARDAWGRWLRYKADRRESYKSIDSASEQLKRCSAWGESRFLAAVSFSIAQNWAGIHEENRQGARAPPRPSAIDTMRNWAERQSGGSDEPG